MGQRTIHKPAFSVFWAVVKNTTIHIGETLPNQRTDTGMGDLITAPSIDELIEKLGPYKDLLPERPRDYHRSQKDEYTLAEKLAELIPDQIYNDNGVIKAPRRRSRS